MNPHAVMSEKIVVNPVVFRPSETADSQPSKAMQWTGWILSALPALMLSLGAISSFTLGPEVKQGFEHLGYPISTAFAIGLIEIACVLLYLYPRTAVFGAILMTAYLGGATASHVRIGESFILPVITGILVWAGLYARDPQFRSFIPLRKTAA